jgi:hypothetical protein
MKSILTFFFCCSFVSVFSQVDATISQVNVVVNIDSIYNNPTTEAQFPGGSSKWKKFVEAQIAKNIKELVSDHKSNGVCKMYITIDREGKVLSVLPKTLEKSRLARIMTTALLKGPKWEPASVNGVKVTSILSVNVTFKNAGIQHP